MEFCLSAVLSWPSTSTFRIPILKKIKNKKKYDDGGNDDGNGDGNGVDDVDRGNDYDDDSDGVIVTLQ